MEYEGIGIGGNIVDKKDVLLFEMNGIDVENYSISEIRKLWCEPNIKLKFKNILKGLVLCLIGNCIHRTV